MTSVGTDAFDADRQTVYLPDGITKIQKNFLARSGVHSIVVPRSVEEIEDCAFYASDRYSRDSINLKKIELATGSRL